MDHILMILMSNLIVTKHHFLEPSLPDLIVLECGDLQLSSLRVYLPPLAHKQQ